MKININSIAELPNAAAVFLKAIANHKIIVFDAKMGVGKTTFIKALLKAMGIDEVVGSPTYSIVNVYDSKKFGRIYHFDLYRIKDDKEAIDIGIEEMLYSDDLCFIEWPEKINDLLPDDVIWSYIRRNEDNTRTLTIDI
jgi:tRNA threonylcarbamoyladenosine biosynthesis protein TsaE